MCCCIRIDHRELELIEILRDQEIEMETASLDHGDVHLLYENQTEIVIERKSFQDVLSSIHDGRWSEQKIRAFSCLPTTRIFYIIEVGNDLWSDDHFTNPRVKHFSNISHESGFHAIINLFIVYNIPFLFVKNPVMTVHMIQLLSKQLGKKKENFDFQASYEKSFIKSMSGIHSKKKENLDSSMYYLHCLMGIPSISHKTATQIKTLFPTLQRFTEFIKRNSVDELQTFWKTKYNRKLNTNSINFIYKVYGHEETIGVANAGESPLTLELLK